MLPMEIERKFTIKYLPKEIESMKQITQKHIFRDMVCSIRVRKSIDMLTGEKIFTHTIKAKTENLQKYSICELEKKISEEEYQDLKPFHESQIIEKYRCVIPVQDGLKAEVDIFQGWMKGLIVAEVEFKTLEQAKKFEMPDWFEKEVSHQEFSNRKLSTKSRKEILQMVGKEQLITNQKIMQELEKRLAAEMR